MKKLFTYIIAIFCLNIGFASSAKAQSINGSDLAISVQGWYGFDIEKSRPNLTSYGYMNYEAAVGIQTKPENQNPFAEAFGFPLIDIGISIARAGNFKFSDQTHFPNLYSAYGSFERSILRTERCSAGYLLTFGATYNPAKYDPVNNPGYSPLSVGIAVVQEVYWRNFAVHVAIGAYPYRHKGVNGPEAKAAGDRERGGHYEKAGTTRKRAYATISRNLATLLWVSPSSRTASKPNTWSSRWV